TPWSGKIKNDEDTSCRDSALAMQSKNCPALVFGSHRVKPPERTRQILIWDKGPALGMGALDLPWKPSYEQIYVIGYGWRGPRDSGAVLCFPPVQSMAKNGRVHPNEKPTRLLVHLLQRIMLGTV